MANIKSAKKMAELIEFIRRANGILPVADTESV